MEFSFWQRQIWMLPTSVIAIGLAVALSNAREPSAGEQPVVERRVAAGDTSVPQVEVDANAAPDDEQPPTF